MNNFLLSKTAFIVLFFTLCCLTISCDKNETQPTAPEHTNPYGDNREIFNPMDYDHQIIFICYVNIDRTERPDEYDDFQVLYFNNHLADSARIYLSNSSPYQLNTEANEVAHKKSRYGHPYISATYIYNYSIINDSINYNYQVELQDSMAAFWQSQLFYCCDTQPSGPLYTIYKNAIGIWELVTADGDQYYLEIME